MPTTMDQLQFMWWASALFGTVLHCLAAPSQAEVDALLSLKQLSAIQGVFSNWTVDNSMFVCSNWSGVRCNQAHTHVTELRLRDTGLQGRLPAQFANLSRLEVVSLGRNRLQGSSFPSRYGWPNLKWFDLSDNNFVGFPPSLEASAGLRLLSLRSNGFQGELPGWLWNLTNLTVLDLSSNRFQGIIPPQALALLTGFHENITIDIDAPIDFHIKGRMETYNHTNGFIRFSLFDVSENNLKGNLPSDFGSALYYLNLSRNSFSGGIPNALGNLAQLQMLDLSNNQLTGSIPSELENLHYLASFDVSNNQLAGKIPQGGQFLTFGASSFQGNPGLCGLPISPSCMAPAPAPPLSDHVVPSYRAWWRVGLALGIVVGYGGVGWMVVFWDSAWDYTFGNS